MIIYFARRLLLTIPLALVVLTMIFILVRVAPGDPAVAVLGDYASGEAVEALRERMGLNRPLWLQYFDFLGALFRGNLGRSLVSGVPVAIQVRTVLPYTLQLTFAALLIGLTVGVPLGILAALNRNRFSDYVGRILSLAGLSVPSFFLGILMMLLFSIHLKIFPTVGGGNLSNPLDMLNRLFLPAATLGLITTAYITRITRSSMLNTLSEEYVRTARSKGLSERVVVFAHAFRNALIPIISITAINTVVLISSSVMIEIVFARQGLGKLLIGAMKQRDYITLQSVMVIYATSVVIINLVTDVLYAIADPRIRCE